VITLIALPGFRIILGVVALVGGQGASDIDRALELAVFVTANVAFVGSSIDKLTFRHAYSPVSQRVRGGPVWVLAWRFVARSEKTEKPLRSPSRSCPFDTPRPRHRNHKSAGLFLNSEGYQ
jgi:hypothetical protein